MSMAHRTTASDPAERERILAASMGDHSEACDHRFSIYASSTCTCKTSPAVSLSAEGGIRESQPTISQLHGKELAKMTSKDYKVIAEAMARSRDNYSALPMSSKLRTYQEQQLCCEANLVAELQYDNPRFDPAKFLKACRR